MKLSRLPNQMKMRQNRRNVLCVALLALLLLGAPFVTGEIYAQDGGTVHVVTAGENLSSIASRYNVSLSALKAYNNITNPNLISPGQRILIPNTVQPLPTTEVPSVTPVAEGQQPVVPTAPAESTPVSPSNPDTPKPTVAPTPTPVPRTGGGAAGYTANGEPVYTVRWGDNLTGIAAQYGVTVSAIINRNGLSSSSDILVSQRLIIPLSSAAPTPTKTYQTPTPDDGSPTQRNTATPRNTATATATPQPTHTPTSRSWLWPFSAVPSTPTPGGRL